VADEPEAAVIGGAEMLALFGPLATRFELTEVHGALVATPRCPIPARNGGKPRAPGMKRGPGHPAYTFVTLDRSPHLEEGSKP
jgi:dihydrofolate reductase